MAKIKFNTGRYYAPEGQIIEAEEFGTPFDQANLFRDEQWIIFNDITRQIKGKITFCRLNETDIMKCYDKGFYEQG